MRRTFTLGLVLLPLVWLLQRLYELMPAQQGWMVFSSIMAVAMALGHKATPKAGGTN